MIQTRTIYQKAVEFHFSTMYSGRLVHLTISPAKDRFAVFFDDRLMGHIKIGYERHTWYVTDSNYVEYELVKEIGRKIVERFY